MLVKAPAVALCGVCLPIIAFIAVAQTPAKSPMMGAPAFVIDERIAALRERPDVKSRILTRLRRGRRVGVLGASRARSGARFLEVAVSRRRRGFVLEAALARRGQRADAERLLDLIAETDDDYARAQLARLCADEYRGTSAAPPALRALGEAAERAAARLTGAALRRLARTSPARGLSVRDHLLSDASLDRFNRLGVGFETDGTVLVYDQAAWREILRRYPRSPEAAIARDRLRREPEKRSDDPQ